MKNRLERLSSNAEHVFVIHYSCESFYNTDSGLSPRVTSIAVRNFSSGQTMSFSIHKVAELSQVPLDRIRDGYDDLEKKMLQEFYNYVGKRADSEWVHWNMRDTNYGFAALEHRLSVLGGDPIILDEQRKFDLSRALVTLYGRGYTKHPRIESLMEMNSMTSLDFLSGLEEARAFEEGKYIELHMSTLRKVDTLCSILEAAIGGKLRTRAKWSEIHDIPYGLISMLKDNWITILSVVASILAILATVFGFFDWVYQYLKSI